MQNHLCMSEFCNMHTGMHHSAYEAPIFDKNCPARTKL